MIHSDYLSIVDDASTGVFHKLVNCAFMILIKGFEKW